MMTGANIVSFNLHGIHFPLICCFNECFLSGVSMSVLPPHFLEPISFENSVGGRGGGGRSDFKKKPQHDIWHVQLEQPQQKPSSKQQMQQPMRESPAKISQLENSIAFMNKQHNEVLKSLQLEVDTLKTKNRGSLLTIFFVNFLKMRSQFLHLQDSKKRNLVTSIR